MHSVLFVAIIPDRTADWERFSESVEQKLRQDANATKLAENVWLLNLRGSPAALGWLIGHAENHNIEYGILPFGDDPQWLPDSFDPSRS